MESAVGITGSASEQEVSAPLQGIKDQAVMGDWWTTRFGSRWRRTIYSTTPSNVSDFAFPPSSDQHYS